MSPIDTQSVPADMNETTEAGSVQVESSQRIYEMKDPAKKVFRSVQKKDAPLDLLAAVQEARASKADETSSDPTRPLLQGAYPNFVLPDIQPYGNRLQESRILVLSSQDPEFCYAVAQAVLLLPVFAECEKRDIISQSYQYGVDQLISAASRTQPRVVAAYATKHVSLPFLASLPSDGPDLHRTVDALKEQNMWLLIVSRTGYIEKIETQDRTLSFPYFEQPVSFLEPRLRMAYGERASKIVEDIRFQQGHGVWGRSEENLLVKVIDRIKDGTLPARIAELNLAIQEGRAQAFREQESPVGAMQLLTEVPGGERKLQPLYQWVMFVGTFFPEMPMREFSSILQLLLSSEAVEEGQADQASAATAPKSLYSFWSLKEYGVLTLCKMHQEVESRKLSAPVIRFVEPSLASEMESAFRVAFSGHYSHALSVVEKGGLILASSPLIRTAVTELLATRAVIEAEYTGSRYMIDVVSSFIMTRATATPVYIGPEDLIRSIEQLPVETRNLLFYQLASLVLKVAEKNQISVARAGLAQLSTAGLPGPLSVVLLRGAEMNAPIELLAEAARILLSTEEFGLFASTLKQVRLTICEPTQGSLLILLLDLLQPHQLSNLTRYLTFYTLSGYRLDKKSNPLALALQDACPPPTALKPLADVLLAQNFAGGIDDDELWELFHRWLAPEALCDDVVSTFGLLASAINVASLRLYLYFVSQDNDQDLRSNLWMASLMLGDTFSALAENEAHKALAAAIALPLEREDKRRLMGLVRENADALTAAIYELQSMLAHCDRTQQKTFSKFLQRWKKLRDGLRLAKAEIESQKA